MKQLLAGIVLCTAALGIVVAGDNETQRTLRKANVERIEKNLIKAFRSNSPRLQASAAITLMQIRREMPEYNWSNSIIPLMRIVNGEDNDADARIAAALALHDLRTDRGDFLIVRNARFTSNDRVKRHCLLLAASRQLENATP